MTIGILKEPSYERRVSMLAESAASLIKKGITVLAEPGAGEQAACIDKEYQDTGVQIRERAAIMHAADIILQINPIPVAELNNRDRKSTRLNSSHSQISYAVFCLKKKKKKKKKK